MHISLEMMMDAEPAYSSPNVVGLLPGTDPVLKDEYIVVTAHLDPARDPGRGPHPRVGAGVWVCDSSGVGVGTSDGSSHLGRELLPFPLGAGALNASKAGLLWATNLLKATGHQLRYHGYRDEGLILFERCIEWLDRSSSRDNAQAMLRRKSECLYDVERWEEAYELSRAVDEESGSPGSVLTAFAAARLGLTDEVERILRELPQRGYRPWNWRWQIGFQQARIAAVLGQKERALEFLRQVDEPGSLILAIRTSGDFEILSGDPVFEALLHPRR